MIDFDALVFGPVYDTFGEPAVLTLGPASYDVVVIDNTKGVTIDDGGMIGVQTIRLAVDVRRSALVALGIAIGDLIDGELAFNGATWRIKSFLENGDELRLILMQDHDRQARGDPGAAHRGGRRPSRRRHGCAQPGLNLRACAPRDRVFDADESADERAVRRDHPGRRAQPRRDDA